LYGKSNSESFEKLQGSADLFEDATFPASNLALFWSDFITDEDVKQYYEKEVTAWKRPSEIDAVTPSLWGSEGIKPRGLIPGNLSDSYLLAAAAAIAENPKRIEMIFTNKEYPTNGLFELNLFQRGKPVKEIIDDRLAVGGSGQPINA
jgi:hypothetical protein